VICQAVTQWLTIPKIILYYFSSNLVGRPVSHWVPLIFSNIHKPCAPLILLSYASLTLYFVPNLLFVIYIKNYYLSNPSCKIQPRNFLKIYIVIKLFIFFSHINLGASLLHAYNKAYKFHRLGLKANTWCGL